MLATMRGAWFRFLLVAVALSLLVYGAAHAGRQSRSVLAAPADPATVVAVSGVIGPARVPITLPVQVASVQRLGAATVQIGYDPALLRVTGCQRNPVFDVGLCNIALDRDSDGVPDAVLFNVISLNGVSAAASPVALVQITWAAVGTASAEVATTLGVTITTFTDPDAVPLPVTAVDGLMTLAAVPDATATPTATTPPTSSPTATPTVTPASTPTPTVTPTPTSTPTPTDTPTATSIPTSSPTATPTSPIHQSYLPLLFVQEIIR